MASGGDAIEYRYIEGMSTDGIFYLGEEEGGDHIHMIIFVKPLSGAEQEPGTCSFHSPVTCTKLYSSTMGLILCEPYCMFNAMLDVPAEKPIPSPPRQHLDHHPRALIVYKNEDAGYHVFHVVCALPSTDPLYPPGVAHAFDVWSSNTEQWHLSSDHVLGRIRGDTKVSCGTRAYWLTETPSVVRYDVVDGSVDILPVPLKFWDSRMRYQFQLGQRDVDLCFVVLTEMVVELYTLGADRRWFPVHSYQFRCCRPMIPIRFQSKKFQVLMWDNGQYLRLWESAWDLEDGPASGVSNWRVRRTAVHNYPQPNSVTDILPFIKTNLDPEEDFPTDV